MLNLDTHILIWSVSGELTAEEERLLSQHQWGISGIVLWEMAKLVEKKRIAVDLEDPALLSTLAHTHIWPIDLDVCQKLADLDFSSDPADELIAATSLVHRVPLLTRDRKIKKSKLIPFA